MVTPGNGERIEILSAEDVGRTLSRLACQVLECVGDVEQLLLLGIPTRGVQLSAVLARFLEEQSGQSIAQGTLDPTFHRDDLERVAMRPVQATELPVSVEWKGQPFSPIRRC